MRVVFPAPRKPVMIVAGILANKFISWHPFHERARVPDCGAGQSGSRRERPASAKTRAPRRAFLDETAGLLARGSSPRAPFPGPDFPNPSGFSALGFPLTVAGAAAARGALDTPCRIPFYPSKARDRYGADTKR